VRRSLNYLHKEPFLGERELRIATKFETYANSLLQKGTCKATYYVGKVRPVW
jgi:hypothetical protein